MSAPIEPGRTGTVTHVVTDADTAIALGSGDVAVYGTPALLALIEAAACRALDDTVASERTHVGIDVHLEHTAASHVGAQVRATATVTEIDGARVRFSCEAHEGDRLIGRATHTRAIVSRDRFATP